VVDAVVLNRGLKEKSGDANQVLQEKRDAVIQVQ